MNNQYWGQSLSVAGGSFLLSRAILSIEEGFDRGSTTEYVPIGDFNVNSFSHNGAFENTLLLEANSPLDNLKTNTIRKRLTLTNGKAYYDSFQDEDSIFNYSTANGEWGVSGNALYANNLGVGPFAMNAEGLVFSDFVAIAKMKGASAFRGNWYLRADGSGTSNVNFTNYSIRTRGDLSTISLNRFTNGGFTTLLGVSWALSANTYYWLKAIMVRDNINLYTSTNGTGYSLVFQTQDSEVKQGTFGFQFDQQVGNLTVDSIEIYDIATPHTKDDMLRKVHALAGNFNLSTPNDLDSFLGFQGNSGGNWGLSSNGFLNLLNTGTGSSIYHYYVSGTTTGIFSGSTGFFEDFTFECSIRGTSGAIAGLFLGGPSDFYVNSLYFNRGSSILPKVEQSRGATIASTTTNMAPHLGIHNDIWYRAKIVNKSGIARWYINDTLSGYLPLNLNRYQVGVAVNKTGPSGRYVEFKDPVIKTLDLSSEDLEIDPNQTLQVSANRLLPDGFDYKYAGTTLSVILVGSSQGTGVIGLSDYVNRSEANYDNSRLYKLASISGEDSFSLAFATSTRTKKQVDRASYNFEIDTSLDSTDDANIRANAYIRESTLSIEQNEVSLVARPSIEKFDQINFVDNVLGISNKYLIMNQSKQYRASDGSFNQRLTLSLYEGN